MKNKTVLKIMLFFVALVNIFIIQNKVFAADMEQMTYFEDIGKYSIAIAGNNNACRGTERLQGVYLIKDYPKTFTLMNSSSIIKSFLEELGKELATKIQIPKDVKEKIYANNKRERTC